MQVLSDNVTAIAYLNHMGGQDWLLSTLAMTIFVECQDIGVHLKAKFLAGKNNAWVDRLSHQKSHFKWKLNPLIFRKLDQMWGPHKVDRFASLLNNQLPEYNSFFRDPCTSGVIKYVVRMMTNTVMLSLVYNLLIYCT